MKALQRSKGMSAWLLWLAIAALPPWITTAAETPTAKLQFTLRSRVAGEENGSRDFHARFTPTEWQPSETAIIICDMWDKHWCPTATARVGELAPRINQFVAACRNRGVMIVHAPSECMKFYADHPARKRAAATPKVVSLPEGIETWCNRIPAEEKGEYPIDQSDGGCDCENPPKSYQAWSRQIEAIGIDEDRDYITADGIEIWSIFEERGIKNVMLCGVHTNMCVLGRPFGLRNMSRFGKNAVLVRDLTDTMYNPKARPQVNHFRGTQLIVEHIEKFVSPTITSDQVLGDAPFRFKEDMRPRIVMAISEPEYKTDQTLPVFAADELEARLGYDCAVLQGDPKKHQLPSLAAALKDADLLFVSMRRQALPNEDLTAIRTYLAAGKPLVAIRTASHAFDPRGNGPSGRGEWPTFDPDVLGGHYTGHYGNSDKPQITLAPGAERHSIVSGLHVPFTSAGSLYKTKPLASSATALLMGTIQGAESEPVAWTNHLGEARIFYTSLGHEDDFQNDSFVRLLANAVQWCLAAP
jgi:nicotinamidase-related amidase/type 1 glutamine amidotransferase